MRKLLMSELQRSCQQLADLLQAKLESRIKCSSLPKVDDREDD